MSTRYDNEAFLAEAGTERDGKGSGCLKGCLIALVVLGILAVVLGVVVYLNWRNWYASMMSAVGTQLVESSDLPEQEKREVLEQVNRVAKEFRSGQISGPQLGILMQNLVRSPVITAMMASVVDQKYLQGSGLSDDEKAAGRQSVRRLVRGMVDGKIAQASTDSIMQHIATRGAPNEPWTLKPTVTDGELREFLAAAKTEADKAEIPAEPAEFDPSDELKKVIDATLSAPVPM
jgi:hypothetical protein